MLRLSALQINSVLGKPAQNIARAERLVAANCDDAADAANFKLLVLPELAFTGYNFSSPEEIIPFAESQEGPTVQWAQHTAATRNTHVIVGFPEKSATKLYNTAAFVGPTGILGFHRKTHLFHQDKIWGCTAGNGFGTLGPFPCFPWKIQIGICMDINPYEFTAPFTDFEFASALKSNGAQLAAVPMAWQAEESGPETDKRNVEYWQIRQPHPIPTVFANRCGSERGTLFAGSSTICCKGVATSLGFGEGIISAWVRP